MGAGEAAGLSHPFWLWIKPEARKAIICCSSAVMICRLASMAVRTSVMYSQSTHMVAHCLCLEQLTGAEARDQADGERTGHRTRTRSSTCWWACSMVLPSMVSAAQRIQALSSMLAMV